MPVAQDPTSDSLQKPMWKEVSMLQNTDIYLPRNGIAPCAAPIGDLAGQPKVNTIEAMTRQESRQLGVIHEEL
jgi:hypothetical protein